jgi:sensor histidine kinase YesM
MPIDILKFVGFHNCVNELTQSFPSIAVCIFYIPHQYLLIIICFSLSVFLKLLKMSWLVLICPDIQLPFVFWASVNSFETDKYYIMLS